MSGRIGMEVRSMCSQNGNGDGMIGVGNLGKQAHSKTDDSGNNENRISWGLERQVGEEEKQRSPCSLSIDKLSSPKFCLSLLTTNKFAIQRYQTLPPVTASIQTLSMCWKQQNSPSFDRFPFPMSRIVSFPKLLRNHVPFSHSCTWSDVAPF